MEYDEATCWTAWELRARGLAVPESVPDAAWIRRCDVRLVRGEAVVSDGAFRVAMSVTFLAPFRWVELTVEVP